MTRSPTISIEAIKTQQSPVWGWVCAVSIAGTVIALVGVRGMVAIGIRGVLDWDETYYASIAATARAGLGLYPYVQGYPEIPVMGGIGHIAYLYVWCLQVFGAAIAPMRLVSFVASLAGLAGAYVLASRWYGSLAGLVALLCSAGAFLFTVTNSIRLDALTAAFVAWALVVFAGATDGPRRLRPHVLVGALLGIGLEFHLHTTAAASAVGFAYLSEMVADRRARCTGWHVPVVGYAIGYSIGAALFVVMSILPSPTTYFRSAALTRLAMVDPQHDSTHMDAQRLAATFTSPRAILRKEFARYRVLVSTQPRFETCLWLVGLAPLLWRRHRRDRSVGALLAGAIVGGAIVFNGESVIYLSHVWPILILPIGPLVTHGFTGRDAVDWRRPSPFTVAIVLVICVKSVSAIPATLSGFWDRRGSERALTPAAIKAQWLQSHVSSECHLAGDPAVYVPYFMAYPKFTGTRATEVQIGSAYYDLTNRLLEYWRRKRPDVVFGELSPDLTAYVHSAGYLELRDTVWLKPDDRSPGCAVKSE